MLAYYIFGHVAVNKGEKERRIIKHIIWKKKNIEVVAISSGMIWYS